MLSPSEIVIEGRVMDHARGAWAGMRPQWWTATHVPSGLSVTWHDCFEQSQWKQRDVALSCLELMVEGMGEHCLPQQD